MSDKFDQYLQGHDKGADDKATGAPSDLEEMKGDPHRAQGYIDGYTNGR